MPRGRAKLLLTIAIEKWVNGTKTFLRNHSINSKEGESKMKKKHRDKKKINLGSNTKQTLSV